MALMTCGVVQINREWGYEGNEVQLEGMGFEVTKKGKWVFVLDPPCLMKVEVFVESFEFFPFLSVKVPLVLELSSTSLKFSEVVESPR
jgi:hypothetical protein